MWIKEIKILPITAERSIPNRQVQRFQSIRNYQQGQLAQEGLKSPAASKSYQAFLAIKEKSVADPLVTEARRRLGSK